MHWEPSWPDPCPQCRQDTVHELRPARHDGVLFSHRTCPACQHSWLEAAPASLSVNDIVRAYDGDETYVGFVDAIDGDDLHVGGRQVERWQVVIY